MSFYKYENDILLEAPNFVYAPEFSLLIEDKDTYTYPVDGWIWGDTEEEAKTILGV
jgi:hypothetical protein